MGENCIMKSLMICIPHHIQKYDMSGASGMDENRNAYRDLAEETVG
jgi:hypothetical protein